MFDADELEALVLGMRWVKSQADEELSQAAERALGRISSTLPEHLRLAADTSGLFAPGFCENHAPEPWLPGLRHAIRLEHRLQLDYVDANGRTTRRVVRPFIMAFFGNLSRVSAGWCKLRGEFRHFRADRVQTLLDTGSTYPIRRNELIRRWRAETGINPDGRGIRPSGAARITPCSMMRDRAETQRMVQDFLFLAPARPGAQMYTESAAMTG